MQPLLLYVVDNNYEIGLTIPASGSLLAGKNHQCLACLVLDLKPVVHDVEHCRSIQVPQKFLFLLHHPFRLHAEDLSANDIPDREFVS
jgi:hypothetical protein